MLFRDSHNKFTKALFPNLNTNLINNVNQKIDDTPLWVQYFTSFQNRQLKNQGYNNKFFKNPYDILGLTQHGNRTYWHDMLSADARND